MPAMPDEPAERKVRREIPLQFRKRFPNSKLIIRYLFEWKFEIPLAIV